MKKPVLTMGGPAARFVEDQLNKAASAKAELAEQRAKMAEWFYKMSEAAELTDKPTWEAIGDVMVGKDRP